MCPLCQSSFWLDTCFGIQYAADFVAFGLFNDKSKTLLCERLIASSNSFNLSIHLQHFDITDKCVSCSKTTSVLLHNNLLTICVATTPFLHLLYRHHVPGCHNLQMFMGSVLFVHMQLVTVRTSCLVHLFSRVTNFQLMLCWQFISCMGQDPQCLLV